MILVAGGAPGNNKTSVIAMTSSAVDVSAPHRLHCEDGAACVAVGEGALPLPWTPHPCHLFPSPSHHPTETFHSDSLQ